MQQIIITLSDRGELNVKGPLENKILALGMLELAKSVVSNHKPSSIIKPELNITANLNGEKTN